MKKKILIDMDGTLFKFEYHPMSIISAPGYFINRPVFENIKKAVKDIDFKDKFEIYIFSSVLDLPHSIGDKNQCLDRHFPEIAADHRIFVLCGRDKIEQLIEKKFFAEKERLLYLDDNNQNLVSAKRFPYITPIKAVNDINDRRGTWDGKRVNILKSAEEIKQALFSIEKEMTGGL